VVVSLKARVPASSFDCASYSFSTLLVPSVLGEVKSRWRLECECAFSAVNKEAVGRGGPLLQSPAVYRRILANKTGSKGSSSGRLSSYL
jgi:hypothetical protein